jgi:DNA polymerase-3 subunit alpha
MAGGFDSFKDIQRHQFFENGDGNTGFIEQLIRYGNKSQSQSGATPTLFGDLNTLDVVKPKPVKTPEWPPLLKLNREKEVIGIYLSAHPLDNFKVEIKQFSTTTLAEMRELETFRGKDIAIAGMITTVRHATTKTGKPFGSFSLEDYTDSYSVTLFSKDYENFRKYLYEGYSLLIKGTVGESTWKNNPELEFRIKSMHLLSSVREELVKSLQLRIPLEVITDPFVTELEEYLKPPGGTANLKVLVYDPADNISVDLFCRTQRIVLSDELIGFLELTPEIEFKLGG